MHSLSPRSRRASRRCLSGIFALVLRSDSLSRTHFLILACCPLGCLAFSLARVRALSLSPSFCMRARARFFPFSLPLCLALVSFLSLSHKHTTHTHPWSLTDILSLSCVRALVRSFAFSLSHSLSRFPFLWWVIFQSAPLHPPPLCLSLPVALARSRVLPAYSLDPTLHPLLAPVLEGVAISKLWHSGLRGWFWDLLYFWGCVVDIDFSCTLPSIFHLRTVHVANRRSSRASTKSSNGACSLGEFTGIEA